MDHGSGGISRAYTYKSVIPEEFGRLFDPSAHVGLTFCVIANYHTKLSPVSPGDPRPTMGLLFS